MLFSAILARARARPNNSQSESHHNKRFIRERARASKVDFQLAGSLGCETRSHCSCTHADREKSDSSLEEATKAFFVEVNSNMLFTSESSECGEASEKEKKSSFVSSLNESFVWLGEFLYHEPQTILTFIYDSSMK
jgi:hypothetical protein